MSGPTVRTDSGIEVEPVYGPEDDGEQAAGGTAGGATDRPGPGEFPFTRGIYESMYRGRVWTMRQYAGFGTAEETNERFRYLLDRGQTGLSGAFDLPTQMGYDSDAPMAAGEVGRVGVAIDSLDDMRLLFRGIPLGSVSTFGNLSDTRIKTSIHMAGGVTGNPQGVDESWLQDLHVPAMFLVGDRDSNGLQRVKDDYSQAPTNIPVFFGLLAGVGHTDEFTEPNGGRWGRILISWLRWQLADDPGFAKTFEGASCEFCAGDWTAQKHSID